MTASAEVLNSTDIALGDRLNIKLRVDFPNLKKDKVTGYVHSRNYPFLRKDSWYLILTDKAFNGIAGCEKIDIEKEYYEKEFQEML